ncbi:hypothetical protein L873DRAFT_32877 [Choiromyces venosus 120613-1]|uniref:Uncharacterized protein n=1 Tax=Choiromyces venosus 120613-1 TaxID=1336337 RepID=A0A3N4K6P1_9PEZI|nr:hypothetical protein L873DRAFT_32877 [Choiromyces venosus 120613-1]
MELPFHLNDNNFFFFVGVIGRSIPSVLLFFVHLCPPAAFTAFAASAISLASCSHNTSSVLMTCTFVRCWWSPVLSFEVFRTFSQNCLCISCSISFSIIICWRPLDKESIMDHNSHAGVASPFTILTPHLASRQVLREVCGVLGTRIVEVFLVCDCLVSLQASKTHLGFKGCIPAPSHACKILFSVYAHFRAGSNILYIN